MTFRTFSTGSVVETEKIVFDFLSIIVLTVVMKSSLDSSNCCDRCLAPFLRQ
jgi:hypothetical protein